MLHDEQPSIKNGFGSPVNISSVRDQKISELESKLDEKEKLILQLREGLEKEKNRTRYDGKDQHIARLENQLSQAVDELATEKAKRLPHSAMFEDSKFQLMSLSAERESMNHELERIRDKLVIKETHVMELEQHNRKLSDELERARSNLKLIGSDKDSTITELKQQLDDLQHSLSSQRNMWESYESSKQGIMGEMESHLENAARELEQEARQRKELQAAYDKLAAAHREVLEKNHILEKEASSHNSLMNDLEKERKKLLDTLLSEREQWVAERNSYQQQLESKHNELISTLRSAQEKAEMEDKAFRKSQDTITAQKAELAAVKAKLQEHFEARHTLEAERDSERRNFQSKLKATEEDFAQRTKQLQEENQELNEIADKFQDTKNQLRDIMARYSNTEHERLQQIAALNDELQAVKRQNMELNSELSAVYGKLQTTSPSTERLSLSGNTQQQQVLAKIKELEASTNRLKQENDVFYRLQAENTQLKKLQLMNQMQPGTQDSLEMQQQAAFIEHENETLLKKLRVSSADPRQAFAQEQSFNRKLSQTPSAPHQQTHTSQPVHGIPTHSNQNHPVAMSAEANLTSLMEKYTRAQKVPEAYPQYEHEYSYPPSYGHPHENRYQYQYPMHPPQMAQQPRMSHEPPMYYPQEPYYPPQPAMPHKQPVHPSYAQHQQHELAAILQNVKSSREVPVHRRSPVENARAPPARLSDISNLVPGKPPVKVEQPKKRPSIGSHSHSKATASPALPANKNARGKAPTPSSTAASKLSRAPRK